MRVLHHVKLLLRPWYMYYRRRKKLKTKSIDPYSELLKYIIEDTTIRGVQEITKYASSKEGKYSERASEIKGDIEKLSDLLMSSIEEQGESIIYDIMETSKKSLAQLDSCVINAKNILIEATEEGIFKLTDTAEKAITHGIDELKETTLDAKRGLEIKTGRGIQTLEDSTVAGRDELIKTTIDGKNELLVTTKCGTVELKDTFERAKNDMSEFIGCEKQKIIYEREEQRESKLTKAKSDLHQQLLNYYQATSVTMNVRLDIDAAVEDIYEKPKLILKNRKDKDGKMKDKEISEMNDMFLSENGTMAKTVFVVGEPGHGKSSLCKKIVHSWCELKKDGNEKTKKDNLLSQFGFLFYIRLREAADQCKIKDMILLCLIERIHSDDKESSELLTEILKSECCLLLLDGLDEWTHCSKCNRDERIPHVETSWMNCTTLITTRPYKLAELKLNPSQRGNHMQLEGVKSPVKLVSRILKELEKYGGKRPHTCVEDLKMKGLWHFKDDPIVLVHIVWLWFRDHLNVNMCLSEVYKKIIEERWAEMNDKKKMEENELPEEFLDSLSKLAFNKLFSANEDESIVFCIAKDQLERKCHQSSLESGIMSCSSKIGERLAFYQFLHKSLQEYLSALYLAKGSKSDLLKHCQHVQEVYRKYRREGVLSMRQVFLFLCSMDINASKVFSKSLNELLTDQFERNGFSDKETIAFQDMILQGYEEAERGGHAGAEFCLQHVGIFPVDQWRFDYNIRHQQKTILKHCLDKKNTLVTLYISGKCDLPSALQGKNHASVLDLEIYKNLKFVVLDNVPYRDINKLNWNGLKECKIQFNSFIQPAKKLISSFMSSDVSCLKRLSMKWIGWEHKAQKTFSKLQHIEHLDVTWKKTLPKNSKFDLDLRHLEKLNYLVLKGLAFSDVFIPHRLNLHKLKVSFSTQKRAPRLMAALLAITDDSISPNLDGPLSTLTNVKLGNMIISEGTFRRLVSIVIQSGHSVNCKLDDCTIEPEEDVRQLQLEMENQSALQMVALQPVSADYTTHITIANTTMSAGEFRRLISIVIQSGHSVNCELESCILEPDEDVRQLQVEMENQSALPMVVLQPVSADYTTHIAIMKTTMSAGEFRRLVSIVIQSGHSVNCDLGRCTIEPEEDVRQLQVEMENQSALQMVVLQPVSADNTTHITIEETTMSAGEFRRLVSIVIQSGHSVNCELWHCTINPEEDVRQLQVEMENQSALQMVVLQPVSADYTTHITIRETTMSAGEFRRLVSIVIQSGHSVNCVLWDCILEPDEDVRQLQLEMENQSALQMVALQPVSAYSTTHITIKKTTMSAGAFRRLVSIVIQSGHSVNCELWHCTIKPEEDVRQLQVEMENQSALQMVVLQPVSADYTTHITIRETTMSAGEFRRLVSIVIQSGNSVNCDLGHCTIEPEEDVRQLQVEMENQSALQMVVLQPVSADNTTHITIEETTMSAGEFRRLVSIVIQSGHSVNCELWHCTIKPEEDVRQLQVEMENQSALQMVVLQPVSADYTTHITIRETTMSAGEFRRLVSIVIQSGHSVNCELGRCTIEPEEDVRQLLVEMENQSALPMVALQPVSADYTTHIAISETTMSAGEFRRLVSIVIQSGHSVNCELEFCTIEPKEDVRQLLVEMENQSAVKLVRAFQVNEFHFWYVEFNVNVNESTEPEESLLSFGSNSPCSDASKEPELSVQAFRNNSHFSVASTEPEESLQATGSRSPCSVASAEPEVPLQASGRSSPCSAASTEPEQSLQASGSNTLTPSAPKKAKMTP
ncbi:uncharacterized protein LOC128222914 isoform X2 [Mya arenaria]|uniref:uncharacterized protein LOC128222914 isoform X2 n=1 Tax=Mya arenaria TaxID=6604 RepID=UPI0022E1E3DF|nr:uncharacterized protein LOC128222914 isoform X2 [Mya arenaria]